MTVILIEDVAFDDFDGRVIMLAIGTRVLYDPEFSVGLFGDHHFHLESYEFSPEH